MWRWIKEFGTSKAWIGWLQEKRLDYRVRLGLRTRLGRGRGRACIPVGRLCAGLLPEQRQRWAGHLHLFGQRVWLAAVRLPAEAVARAQAAKHARGHAGQPGDQWVIIAAPARERTGRGCAAELLEDYRLRWSIEMLFGALKSRGFDLESTALPHGERLERLLARIFHGLLVAGTMQGWVRHGGLILALTRYFFALGWRFGHTTPFPPSARWRRRGQRLGCVFTRY